MIPKSDLFGASFAAPQSAASILPPELPASSSERENNFFTMVSHAFARNPDKPPEPQPHTAPSLSPQDYYNTARDSDDESDDSQTAAVDAATAKDQPS
ncbi:MAG TPA: hypothetical protein VFC07_15875, partial [Verrucomicrobiae bacterium]|nr:hypothetical protein [Verrucomicrobiae bacterium]